MQQQMSSARRGSVDWSPGSTAAVTELRFKQYACCFVFRARVFVLYYSHLLLDFHLTGQSVTVLSVAKRAEFTGCLDLLTMTQMPSARLPFFVGW